MSSEITINGFTSSLGEGFAYGTYPTFAFNLYNKTSNEFTSQISETYNFTQKIGNMEDFLHLSSDMFDFEGFSQGESKMPSPSSGVSFIVGYGVLGSTTVIDQGLETLVLSNPAKTILNQNYPQFLNSYGFHAYDSITSGWIGICKYDLYAFSFKEEEVLRDALENVTTDIFYNEKKYDELQAITSNLPFTSDYSCKCSYAGVPRNLTFLDCNSTGSISGLGDHLDKLLDIPLSALNLFPIRATVAPYSNSFDFQSKVEKLSADDTARFYNDARVNFTLTEEVARILMENNAKSEYVKKSAEVFSVECHLMNDIRAKAVRNRIRHTLNNATELRVLSTQITEGNYVGDGSKLVKEYRHKLNNATELRVLSTQNIEGNYVGDGSKLVKEYHNVVKQCFSVPTYPPTTSPTIPEPISSPPVMPISIPPTTQTSPASHLLGFSWKMSALTILTFVFILIMY